MKKIFLSLIVLTLAFAGCKKDEETTPSGGSGDAGGITVAEINTSMVIKHTGSRCPPCGNWGWNANEDIISTNKGSAAFMSAYGQNFVAQLFINSTATALQTHVGATGYPTWSANGQAQLDRSGGGVNVNGEKAKVEQAVKDHKAAAVVANVGFTTSYDGDKLMIDTRTKFFKEAQGNYNLTVFVLEDGVVGAQSGHPNTPNVAHHHVVRGTAVAEGSSSVDVLEGMQIANGSIAAGSTYDQKFTFDVAGYDKANIEVIAVIWKKDLGSLDFINASTDQK